MKWTFVIRQKTKVAMLMALVMALIVVTNLINRKSIKEVDKAIATIYNDRLVPATDIFMITELMHQKITSVDKMMLAGGSSILEYATDIKVADRKINDLINKFGHTYLVEEEQQYLGDLKSTLSKYNELEQEVIYLNVNGQYKESQSLYVSNLNDAHEETIKALTKLNTIQSVVGNKIIEDSRSASNLSALFSSLQIVLAIVIGACIIQLVAASKLVSQQPQDNFNLN